MTYRPVILVVLDGWGNNTKIEGNAIALSNIPFYNSILKYPVSELDASGEAVGLPEGQMGNSEVGHLNLGAGRIVYQDYTRINRAIKNRDFFNNEALLSAMRTSKDNGSALHLMGLLSDGGVHSHIDHLIALLDMAKENSLSKVFVHAFLDGRDTPPSSALSFIKKLLEHMADGRTGEIGTIMGRYYAMDRDKRWERVKMAYDAIVLGEGRIRRFEDEAIEYGYSHGETDEFIFPSVITTTDGKPRGIISDGDAVIFFNFRADRARELTRALTEKEFDGFQRGNIPNLSRFVTMTSYDERFTHPVAFPPEVLSSIFAEVISRHGLKQLRIAETEKYAHVTYFFNGGEEVSFEGEDRCLIPSPRNVSTYDKKPEMSALEVTDEVVKRIESRQYDFILLNYANPDMVGHTGSLQAAIAACEAIDKCLQRVVTAVENIGGIAIITSDHGNCEEMIDKITGEPHTAHTTNPVPFILLKKGVRLRGKGILADVAPTILEIMGLDKPLEMSGESLIMRIKG
ncbi:MAG: 2,3-bisphosphoglycerate-independent phosphoglycerate mutase [Nitrospirota bacterium]